VLVLSGGAGTASAAMQTISSGGPLTNIYLSDDLACQVDHTGDEFHQFYNAFQTHGDCGTFIWAGGDQAADNVYGPQPLADSNSRLFYTMLSQTAVTGSGTSADPYKVVTVVGVGDTGLQITQTDSYVAGNEFYRTDVQVANSTGADIEAALYHAADCLLQDSDDGYGFHDSADGGIYCSVNPDNTPTARIEGFVPQSPGSSYIESEYSLVWDAITGVQFPSTCDCAIFQDNGTGLSWSITVPANGSVTRSLLSNFSPTGATPGPGPPATLALSPDSATNTVGAQHCVTATVKDTSGGATPNIEVVFAVTGANSAAGSQQTDSSGQAQFCYTGPLPGQDAIEAYADTNASSTRDPGEPGGSATKSWVAPESTPGCKITGGGHIEAANGDRASFSGNAKVKDKGKGKGKKGGSSSPQPSGNETYHDHGPADPMTVKTITVTAVVCADDGRSAGAFGLAKVNGEPAIRFRIDVQDLGEPGRRDTYRIRLSNGYDSGEQRLQGGNIQVH
jgi:hypothetical protein